MKKLEVSSLAPSSQKLKNLQAHLRRHREFLFGALKNDTGKGQVEAFLTEWSPVESTFKFLEAEREGFLESQRIDSAMDAKLGRREIWSRPLPLGKVLVIGTWNYPLALHLNQIIAALSLGNEVYFKASPLTPQLGKALEEVFAKSEFSKSFHTFLVPSNEALLDAIRAGAFQLVIFTGGTVAARAIGAACGEALCPFVAEASGVESAILLNNAPRAESLDHLLWASFHYQGQTCVAPRFIFVPTHQLDVAWVEVKEILDRGGAEARKCLSPLQDKVLPEHTAWCDWIRKANLSSSDEYAPKTLENFRLFKIKNCHDLPLPIPANFGPALALVGYSDLKSVQEWIEASPWSLMTSVFGEASSYEHQILEKLSTSIVSWQESVLSCGDAAVPFGGRDASGMGRCHGLDGLAMMSRRQSWVEAKAWPGAKYLGLPPRWSGMAQVQRMASMLKDFETSPLEFIRSFKRRFENEHR